jgi:hypothetical protein
VLRRDSGRVDLRTAFLNRLIVRSGKQAFALTRQCAPPLLEEGWLAANVLMSLIVWNLV